MSNTGPSLFKLVHATPEGSRLRLPADALVIIGRQLELLVQDQRLAADVSLGTLRFSLFRLHQGRIAQLATRCRSITVYGEADVEPPDVPGVQFVPLPPGTPLCHEWFLVVDSEHFWGALLTQAVPDRRNGNLRRYLFEGALTNDERIVSRTNLLLSLTQRRAAPNIGARNAMANRVRWANIVYALVTHSEAERLDLNSTLHEFPELLDILPYRTQPLDQLLPQSLRTLRRIGATGEVVYRYDERQLHPLIWSGPRQPPILGLQDDGGGALARWAGGLAGQALQQGAPVLATLSRRDPEQALLPEARSVVAVPLTVQQQPWGVMLIGQPEDEPDEAPTALAAVGVGALLERILTESAMPTAQNVNSTPREAMNGNRSTPALPIVSAPAPLIAPMTPPITSVAPLPTNGAANNVRPSAPLMPSIEPPAAPPPLPSFQNASFPPTRVAPPEPENNVPSGSFGLPAWIRGGFATTPQNSPAASSNLSAPTEVQTDRSWAMLQRRMMGALIAFDQRSAEYVWNEACSLYTTEAVCTELLMPVQIAIGEGWHRGDVSVAAEHFCSRFVQGKLLNLLNAHVDNPNGPLAVVGCAQNELHELGAIMLSLFMRWSGFRVIYLGQNVPNTTILETVRQLRPQILALSATTFEAAFSLSEVGQIVSQMEPPRPQFIYGGMAFYERPDMRGRIQGQFLEGDVRQIVRQIADQFRK
jgi:methanogenic corrinoid protein MtbC1